VATSQNLLLAVKKPEDGYTALMCAATFGHVSPKEDTRKGILPLAKGERK
jgi:hypothetical protein